MNLVYLFGNGFDINLGLKTKYIEFYDYYKRVKPSSDKVLELKKHIAENITLWADLEIAFGKYTSFISNTIEFDEVYEDLCTQLSIYLDSVEKNFDFSILSSTKFIQDLASPDAYLRPADRAIINSFLQEKKNETINLNIITFNYTNSIEKIIGLDKLGTQIAVTNNNSKVLLRSIDHIHGYTGNRMILGVNDITQIKNKDLHKNQDIIEALIKLESNKSSKENIDIKCADLIKNANLIVLFGLSLGETDFYWWDLIAHQLSNNCRLIIFWKTDDIDPRYPYKVSRIERDIKNLFISKTSLDQTSKDLILNRYAFVGINSKIFTLIE